MTFEDRLARALRESADGDLPPDFAARVRENLPPQRRGLASTWMRPVFSFAAGAAAVLALVAVVWLVSRPVRSVDVGATATPTSSATEVLDLPAIDASDLRFAACGGTRDNAVSAFGVQRASDILRAFPHFTQLVQLANEPAFVVVFKGIDPLSRVSYEAPATPRNGPRVGTHDVCVFFGVAEDIGKAATAHLVDVDVSDFRPGVLSSAPPVTAPPSTTATPPDGQLTPTPQPSVTARPPASPVAENLPIPAPWQIVRVPAPADRTVEIEVTEAACAGGSDAAGRIVQNVPVYTATTITIAMSVRPLIGAQDCQGNPPTPYTVQLSEPVNGRQLLDGSKSPPSPAPTIEPAAYVPPTPTCPAPAGPITPPRISAAVAGAAAVPATQYSYTTLTCSTTATADAIYKPPKSPVRAHAGDLLSLTVPTGWSFVHWERADHAPGDAPFGARSITVPVPSAKGDSVVSLDGVLVTDDGHVVVTLSFAVLVRVG